MKTHFCVKNDLTELHRLNKFIQTVGADRHLSGKTIHDLLLCLEEIFSNIVQYAYNDIDEHQVRVCLILNRDAVQLVVKDDGKPFNPLEVPEVGPKSFDELEIGGFGIQMVRGLSNEVSYRHEDGLNILTMTFSGNDCDS